ncbi:carbamoyl phosphate synthase small subunit [Paenibacillus senegalensis]|uniref:carbamoyl phosphate synthase small subunit n=1 Tax=Paenibacillus senegalensis TaxID=1465766 RepID=UPI000288BA01|nr:carbamoyl phosphate synthase small subunit [Paenibacillus senegalensis]
MKARLLLEDGTLFTGKAFGSTKEAIGEIVFNTGMTGYQEVLSDPSYCGQLVTMTYPLIGNYGFNPDDLESLQPSVGGLIVRQYESFPSNWRSRGNLQWMLQEYDIPAISGIDTRMLTRIIREHGVMRGVLTTGSESVSELLERMQNVPEPRDQVAAVSTRQAYRIPGSRERIVLIDYGSKLGIVKELTSRGCDVTVVPHNTSAEQIRKHAPDGIMLSNGPGNPKDVRQAAAVIQELLGEFPIFGICLGHQLFALAGGADTTKLKYGHRGSNHPVKALSTGQCWITSQNHGYTVDEASLAGTELEITHINNNDKTIEGLKHKRYPAFSVQFHPEAAPGPNDSNGLFDEFLQMVRDFSSKAASSGMSSSAVVAKPPQGSGLPSAELPLSSGKTADELVIADHQPDTADNTSNSTTASKGAFHYA